MVAPRVVGSSARGRLEGAAEVGKREGRHLVGHAELDSGVMERLQRRRELAEQGGESVQLVRMRIEAAERDEEHLTLEPGLRARLDQLGYLLQLLGDRGVLPGEEAAHGRGARGEDGRHDARKRNRLRCDRRRALDECVARVEREQLLQRGQACTRLRAGVEALQADAAARRQRQRIGRLASDEQVGAGDRGYHREVDRAIERRHLICDAPAPAGARKAVGDRGLPLALLVRMRIQAVGTIGLVVGLGGRRIERADVGEEGELLLVEQSLQLAEVGMQPERRRGAGGLDGQQSRLRELDAGARGPHGGVLRVAGAVVGNQHAVAVHAAEEEDADQCLVVRRRRLRGGVAGKRGQPGHASKAVCEAACGKRGGVAKEIATVRVHVSAPRNIARTTGRGRPPSVHGPARRLPVLRSRRR